MPTRAFQPLSGAVLLVEDSPGDARLVMETLKDEPSEEFHVLQADRIATAECILRDEEVGCVLLDLGLPDSSGIQAIRRLKRVAHHVPIVVLSGESDRDTAIRAVQQGAEDYLLKRE